MSIASLGSKLEILESRGLKREQTQAIAEFIQTVLDSGQEKPCEYKKVATGLSRTICFISPEEIYVLFNSSRAHSDPVLGSGTFKTVKTAFNIFDQKFYATYSLGHPSTALESELEARKALGAKSGIQDLPKARLDYVSSYKHKIRMFETLYSGSVSSLIRPTFESADTLTHESKISMAKDMIQGLKQVHEAGYLHRDIKIDNIFFDENRGAKKALVADFGEAEVADHAEFHMLPRGTPLYWSPEYSLYAQLDLEELPDVKAIKDQIVIKETELKTMTGMKSINSFAVKQWKKANPESADSAKVDELLAQIETLRRLKAEKKGIKDLAPYTTQKHDIYALGLVLYALFTSKSDFDSLIASRDGGRGDHSRYELAKYGLDPKISSLIQGMLAKDPSERWGWDQIEAALST
jgi:serine/threonine protein kinase